MALHEDTTEMLETLFEGISVVSTVDAESIDEAKESPLLLAREAARGVLEDDDDLPDFVCEVDGGFVVAGERSAILMQDDGSVQVADLEEYKRMSPGARAQMARSRRHQTPEEKKRAKLRRKKYRQQKSKMRRQAKKYRRKVRSKAKWASVDYDLLNLPDELSEDFLLVCEELEVPVEETGEGLVIAAEDLDKVLAWFEEADEDEDLDEVKGAAKSRVKGLVPFMKAAQDLAREVLLDADASKHHRRASAIEKKLKAFGAGYRKAFGLGEDADETSMQEDYGDVELFLNVYDFFTGISKKEGVHMGREDIRELASVISGIYHEKIADKVKNIVREAIKRHPSVKKKQWIMKEDVEGEDDLDAVLDEIAGKKLPRPVKKAADELREAYQMYSKRMNEGDVQGAMLAAGDVEIAAKHLQNAIGKSGYKIEDLLRDLNAKLSEAIKDFGAVSRKMLCAFDEAVLSKDYGAAYAAALDIAEVAQIDLEEFNLPAAKPKEPKKPYDVGPGSMDTGKPVISQEPDGPKGAKKPLESEAGSDTASLLTIRYPKGKMEEFVKAAKDAGVPETAEVGIDGDEIILQLPQELAIRMNDALNGVDVTAEDYEGAIDEAKLASLKKEAAEAAEFKGHKLGKWKRDGANAATATCTVCGKGVTVNAKPAPDETAVMGAAVAVGCKESFEEARGQGRGQGGPRQGDGGADTCVCPKCGETIAHERGTPCQESTCPKCGTKMVGEFDEATLENLAYLECLLNGEDDEIEDIDEQRWVTTKSGKKIHLDKEGVPDKGNLHVLKAAAKGEGKAGKEKMKKKGFLAKAKEKVKGLFKKGKGKAKGGLDVDAEEKKLAMKKRRKQIKDYEDRAEGDAEMLANVKKMKADFVKKHGEKYESEEPKSVTLTVPVASIKAFVEAAGKAGAPKNAEAWSQGERVYITLPEEVATELADFEGVEYAEEETATA